MSKRGNYPRIFCGILSVPRNTVMELNNVECAYSAIYLCYMDKNKK